MQISKARLKQIIMEEIQKFMVVDEEASPEVVDPLADKLKDAVKKGDEAAAEEIADAIKDETTPDK